MPIFELITNAVLSILAGMDSAIDRIGGGNFTVSISDLERITDFLAPSPSGY